MSGDSKLNRRRFLDATAAITAAAVVPRHVLGGAKHVAPSRRINIGFVGCGTQGFRQLMPALAKPETISAVVAGGSGGSP